MDLSKLPKTTDRPAKRVGRGIGSGKGGHTTGRGNKGQKAREKIPLMFEGTKFKKSLIKRLPLQRGKGKFKPLKADPILVNLKYLAEWPEKTEVTIENLIKKGIVEKNALETGVKILGDGEVKQALVVKVPTSKSALEKITKAGGRIESK